MLGRNSLAKSLAVMLASLVLLPSVASAELKLPHKSPKAKVVQYIGMTKVKVRYFSPAVRKRRIWGALVPYGKVWRTGANGCTRLSLDKNATIGGKQVPAGKYCLLTIPKRNSWTIILSKNTKLRGTRNYKQSEDFVRFTAKPKRAPYRERLTFLFSDVTEDSARLDIWWHRLYVPIPIKVDTRKQALASIKSTETGGHRVYARAAQYLMDNNIQLDRALRLVDRSLKEKSDWYALFIKAQILHKKRQHKDAYAVLQQAKSLGEKAKFFFYKDQVEKALKKWKKR
ncbi:MAG: DUF2911 domain-containing protein [Myxococcales bacterium]|nr:DUF2911 domain-containing protein [Myxococcales bacterium]